MFVRFVCSAPHPTVDAELGMFTANDTLDLSGHKGRIQKAHEEAWYWFSKSGGGGLYRPRLTGKARTRNVRKALFWFREEASYWGQPKGSVVRRARELGQAMTNAGLEVRELRCENPGQVIWDDYKQVLAIPSGPVPRAFKPTT